MLKTGGAWASGTPGYACDPGSRNNLNLHFEFAIFIRQNKCNHLMFYALRFTKFCARNLLLLLVVLKLIINYKVFPQNYAITKRLGRENLEKIFGTRPVP